MADAAAKTMPRPSVKALEADEIPAFVGFPRAGLLFLEQLAENNDREWFDARKGEFQETVVRPTQSFAVALGNRVQKLFPEFVVDPALNGRGSVMKIHRDVRFAADKRPYYTYMRVLYWYESRPRMRGPSLLFWIEPEEAGFMGGMFGFSPDELERYRLAVMDDKRGELLLRILGRIESMDGYKLSGQTLKKVPRGLDPNHPRADMLRYTGLFANSPPIESTLFTKPELVDVCFRHAEVMKPLVEWLVGL